MLTVNITELELANMEKEITLLRKQRDDAIGLLAEWCAAIDHHGTGWDDWDEYYKTAAWRPGPLRELLDAAIAEANTYYEGR